MKFNHQLIHKYFKKFYNEILKIAYTQRHVNGIEFLITSIENDKEWEDLRHVVYALASVLHETGARMEPIEEILAKPGTRVYDLQAKYKPWTGKGYIQLTHLANFKKMSKVVGVDLVANPKLALDPKISYQIMAKGLRRGDFTGKKLSDYINGNKVNYKGARATVNGSDKADKIAYYAQCIETILKASLIKEEEVPQYIPIGTEYEIPTQVEPIEVPQIPFEIDENTDQQEPISTTVTTKTESSTPNSTTTVEVEKNIPAPTQYIEPVQPNPTSGIKSWKTMLSAIFGSTTIATIGTWIGEKYEAIRPFLGNIVITLLIVTTVLVLYWLKMKNEDKKRREQQAFELTLAQLKIRSDPSLTNVEVSNVRH